MHVCFKKAYCSHALNPTMLDVLHDLNSTRLPTVHTFACTCEAIRRQIDQIFRFLKVTNKKFDIFLRVRKVRRVLLKFVEGLLNSTRMLTVHTFACTGEVRHRRVHRSLLSHRRPRAQRGRRHSGRPLGLLGGGVGPRHRCELDVGVLDLEGGDALDVGERYARCFCTLSLLIGV